MRLRWASSLVVWVLMAGLAVWAETVADRKGAVLGDRDRMEDDPRWIYNDPDEGFREGRRTDRPVLVVLRCVPCLACAGMDASVLLEDQDLAPLLDQFVCVRVINANALDLSRFQFDFDLSFSVLVFSGDGTVIGRYGSWAHQEDPAETSVAGFRRALEAALEIFRGYPGYREALAGKQGGPVAHRTPVDLPGLSGKYHRSLDWEGEVLKSCVHCHQIGDAMRAEYRGAGRPIPAPLVYPFPAPETIGLTLAPDQTAQVAGVAAGSPAERSGLRPGDAIESLAGQPLISPADVSWVLHRAPEAGELRAEIRRAGRPESLAIPLPDGWRRQANIGRRVGTWAMRAMVLGGMVLEDLSDPERNELGLGQDGLALRATHVGQYGEHAAAQRAGFRAGDIVVQMDGLNARASEGEMIGDLLDRHPAGDRISVSVLRDGDRLELTLPMQ